jgi:hypothetical protein
MGRNPAKKLTQERSSSNLPETNLTTVEAHAPKRFLGRDPC